VISGVTAQPRLRPPGSGRQSLEFWHLLAEGE
jgi:hypothetical protein